MRLVFGALCDADYLDTAAHFDGLAGLWGANTLSWGLSWSSTRRVRTRGSARRGWGGV
jgi:hypothetical protein